MKLGIMGSGGIVQEVLVALKPLKEIELTSICVRAHSEAKGRELAAAHNIPAVFTDYDDFLQSADIDFVYIGVINSAHYEYTKKALEAGKNVIVEKPFASNASEVSELIALAKAQKLFLFEAVSLLHMPNFAKLVELLPQIGKIKLVRANYSQYSSRYDKYLAGTVLPAFDPQLSGGSLYDINIYNLNLIIGLLGAPENISYHANIGFNGIDTSGIAIMQYPDFLAEATGAKDSDSPCGCSIQGEKGYLHCIGVPGELKSIELTVRKKDTQCFALNQYNHRLTHEFADFAAIFNSKDYAARNTYLDISLNVAVAAENARKSAGIRFAADK